MITKDDVLKLDTRRDIYNFVKKYPGLHMREISRRKNIPLGSLRYHLNYLEKLDIIITIHEHKFNRYYIKRTVGMRDKELINLLRQEVPLRIILMLLTPGPGHIYKDKETKKKALLKPSTFEKTYSKKEIIELTKFWEDKHDNHSLNKHRSTIAFHIQKLLDMDLIEQKKIGREVKYKLKDANEMLVILIKYKDALSKKSINDRLTWGNKGVERGFDIILDIIYEILPHPYHV